MEHHRISYGNCTISVYADAVPGEKDTEDNTFSDDVEICVTIPGDIDADFDVDVYDIVQLCMSYGYLLGEPGYKANCDINGDGEIDIYDVVIAVANYGQSWQS